MAHALVDAGIDTLQDLRTICQVDPAWIKDLPGVSLWAATAIVSKLTTFMEDPSKQNAAYKNLQRRTSVGKKVCARVHAHAPACSMRGSSKRPRHVAATPIVSVWQAFNNGGGVYEHLATVARKAHVCGNQCQQQISSTVLVWHLNR